jgi:integral membrane protein (TIGR01906 family)
MAAGWSIIFSLIKVKSREPLSGIFMKYIRLTAYWLFIICMPVLLLTVSVRMASNSSELYRYGFNKYNISQATGISPEELNKVIGGLIAYFNSGEEYINLTAVKDGKPFTLFNEREVQHLKDVKGLFRLVYHILLGAFIYAFIYSGLNFILWLDKRRVAWGLVWGSVLTLALIIFLGLMIWIDFDWFFYQFHLVSFANDFWQLDPATDYLIMLFPEGFWLDAALFCVLGTAALALILGGSGWWRLRKEKPIEKKQPVNQKVDGSKGI